MPYYPEDFPSRLKNAGVHPRKKKKPVVDFAGFLSEYNLGPIMTILEYTEELLRKGGRTLFFETEYSPDKTNLALCFAGAEELVLTTLLTDGAIATALAFDSLEEAFTYWALNLERETDLPFWDSSVREMKRLIYQWM